MFYLTGKNRMFLISWHAVNVYGNIITIMAELKIQENKTFAVFTASF